MASKYLIKRLVAQLRLNDNQTVSMYELTDGRWQVGYGHHEVIIATSTLAAEEFNTCVTHAMCAEGLIETNTVETTMSAIGKEFINEYNQLLYTITPQGSIISKQIGTFKWVPSALTREDFDLLLRLGKLTPYQGGV